jgi:hypothetical protein
MHEDWKDDEDGMRRRAYGVVKKDANVMLADVTEQMLEKDLETVHTLVNTISDLTPIMVDTDNDPVEVLSALPPELLRSMAVWATVGVRSTFVRAIEAAMMNDQLEDA